MKHRKSRLIIIGRETLICLILLPIAYFGFRTSLPAGDHLWDLGLFLVASRAASLGLNPYIPRPELLGDMANRFDLGTRTFNPPLSVLMFNPASWANPVEQLRVLYLASVVAYIAAVALVAVLYRKNLTPARLAWMIALAAFWHTLFVANVYCFIALVGAVTWFLLARGRWVLAGLALGMLTALKVNYLAVPALLFLAGYRKPALVSLAPFTLLWLAPLAAYGPAIYPQWLATLPASLPASIEYQYVNNASLIAMSVRLGMPWLGLPLSVLLLVSLAAWAWRTRPAVLQVVAVGLVASILASPVGYLDFSLALLPVFMSRHHWMPTMTTAAMLLLVPHQLIWGWSQGSALDMAIAGSVYFAAYMLVLATLAAETRAGFRKTAYASGSAAVPWPVSGSAGS